MSRVVEDSNRRLLGARDAFRATCGETPHRYLQRRRVERSMFMLRETDRSVTEICFAVGFISLGTFSRTFREIVGVAPTGYRRHEGPKAVPTCFAMAWTRPTSSEKRERRRRASFASCSTPSRCHRSSSSTRTRRSTSTSASSDSR